MRSIAYCFSISHFNKVLVHTSYCKLPRLHIRCPSQRDSATLKQDLHRARRPYHRFANWYCSPSRRFSRHLVSRTPQFEIIDTMWACLTHARSSGRDILATKETITPKISQNDRSTRFKATCTCSTSVVDWDETSFAIPPSHRDTTRARSNRFLKRQKSI